MVILFLTGIIFSSYCQIGDICRLDTVLQLIYGNQNLQISIMVVVIEALILEVSSLQHYQQDFFLFFPYLFVLIFVLWFSIRIVKDEGGHLMNVYFVQFI